MAEKYYRVKNLADNSISFITKESYESMIAASKKVEKTIQKRIGKKMVKETILVDAPKYQLEKLAEVNDRGLTKEEEKEHIKIVKSQDKENLKTE